MSNKSSKWLTGCGIGCGVIILLLIIVSVTGYYLVKDTIQGFKRTEITMNKLNENYGEARDFQPNPEGVIGSERIETFLAVRDSIALVSEHLDSTINDLASNIDRVEKEEKSFWKIMRLIGKGMGTIPQLAEFYNTRNNALLNTEMGLGEYYYIYTLAYYSYLGKSPGDGPEFRIFEDSNRGGAYVLEFDDDEDEEILEDEDEESIDTHEERRIEKIRQIRRLLRPMMRSQLEVLKETSGSAWRTALEKELETLKKDRYRIPWQDGLPKFITTSFKPYKEKLEAAYFEMLNPLEFNSIKD